MAAIAPAVPPATPATDSAPRPDMVKVALAFLAVLFAVFFYIFGVFPNLVEAGTQPKLPEDVVGAAKGIFGGLAVLFISWEGIRKLRKKTVPRWAVRTFLVLSALVGVAGYANFGDVGYHRIYHRWDIFHYYMGSKYHDGLGYTGIYEATAVAQAELSPAMREEVLSHSIRNMHTDTIEPASTALDRADEIKAKFTPEKWDAFKKDVEWFRSTCDAKWWGDMQTDHGYNPAPLWTTVGSFFGSLGSASDTFLRFLASLDLVAFAIMFYALYWAFGQRIACLTILYWGIQWPANYYFTWGAFLRHDWILALMLSFAFAKKRKYVAAGVALAYASLIRVFPGFFFGGIALVIAASLVRRVPIRRPHKLLAAGLLAGVLGFGALSVAVAGPRSYPEFVSHVSKLQSAPVTNWMGIRSIVVFNVDRRVERTWDGKLRDPFDTWKALRQATTKKKRFFLWAISLSSMLLYAWVVLKTRSARIPWVGMALVVPVIFSTLELMNYYFTYFLPLCFLGRFGRRFEVTALVAASVSALLCSWQRVTSHYDVRCFAEAIVYFVFAITAFGMFAFRDEKAPRTPETSTPGGAPAEPPSTAENA
ncbi:MAG: hypothetical protein U0169_22200 [Polyangiaceae bacterium]